MTNEDPMKFQMLCETEVDFKKKKKITKERRNDTRRQQPTKELCGVSSRSPACGEERPPLSPSVSSPVGGGGWTRYSGSLVSPYLLFSRLWFNKYELVQ